MQERVRDPRPLNGSSVLSRFYRLPLSLCFCTKVSKNGTGVEMLCSIWPGGSVGFLCDITKGGLPGTGWTGWSGMSRHDAPSIRSQALWTSRCLCGRCAAGDVAPWRGGYHVCLYTRQVLGSSPSGATQLLLLFSPCFLKAQRATLSRKRLFKTWQGGSSLGAGPLLLHARSDTRDTHQKPRKTKLI